MTPNHLFIKLYLDEDVSVLVAELLRPHGFDILSTRDANNLGKADRSQLLFATEQQRTILTHNRSDFENLHRAWLAEQQPHAGIIVANRRASASDLTRRVMKLLNLFTIDEIRNQLLYI